MKTITYDDFVEFEPCWLENERTTEKHAEQLERYREMRDEWTALDILRLDEVDPEDRLWLVLREELIDASILHEFACRCAEMTLSRADKPDERSIATIEAKRKWPRGEISDQELRAARDAARYSARYAARYAAWDDERCAIMEETREQARNAERQRQIAELMRMLEEA